MKNEFVLAFNEVLEEKQLPKEIILRALESAMVSAYRRAVNASNNQHIEAQIDPETGKVTILAEKEVVESVQDVRTEVTLQEAQRYNPAAQLGMLVVVESTPRDFGRVAAQTARQVIQQRIRDAERQAQLGHFQKQLGEIISGVVQAINSQGLTIGLDMRAEGQLARKDMIQGERFHIHDRVRALISEVKDSNRGPQIILSRTHKDFLRRLLETEVPEIYHGVVEIRSIAREPGERAKVAVAATQSGIDPVGACVGIRGVRIQAIVRELHDEKIDVIEYNNDPAIFIAKAISPAKVTGVYLNEKSPNGKTATVVVPEDQLSLAIGRDGQNARLAAKLTNWRIDIKSLVEAAADALHDLQTDAQLAALALSESETIASVEKMLARKAENRMLNPEEYEKMGQFVDRIMRRTALQRLPEKKAAEDALVQDIRQSMGKTAFEINILDSGLAEHITYILQEAGYMSVGELVVAMQRSPDEILRLQGIGPRAMGEIKKFVDSLQSMASHKTTEEVEEPVLAEVVPAEEVKPLDVEPVEEPITEFVSESVEEEILEPAVSSTSSDEAQEVQEEQEEPSFDELFTLRTMEEMPAAEDEEGDDEDKSGKKGKKKKKHVEVEYDPERDVVLVKRKHKRGGGDWDWES
jgi:N utilization substance protein A